MTGTRTITAAALAALLPVLGSPTAVHASVAPRPTLRQPVDAAPPAQDTVRRRRDSTSRDSARRDSTGRDTMPKPRPPAGLLVRPRGG